MTEHLVNPEVPDRQIYIRKALQEIMQILDRFPELKELVRLKISKQYNP